MKANSSIFSSNQWLFAITFAFSALIIIAALGIALSVHYRETPPIPPSNRAGPTDILIIGSSQAQHGYNPILIGEMTGQNVWNLGGAGLHPLSNYYLLKDFLETHTVRTVILDVYWRVLDGAEDLTQLERTYKRIADPEIKSEFLFQGFPIQQRIEHFIPILRYRNNIHRDMVEFISWTLDKVSHRSTKAKVTSANADSNSEASTNNDVTPTDWRGHVHSERIVTDDERGPNNKFRSGVSSVINPDKLQYITKIAELCSSKGITLYAVASPILQESFALVRDYSDVHARLTKLFSDLNVPYTDYNLINEKEGILDSSCFADENHLNGTGANIFSEDLVFRVLGYSK